MKNNIKKVVLFIVILSILGSLVGCEDAPEENVEDKIQQALYEKYGEEFVVDYVRDGYAGTMNSNILTGIARPKRDKSIRVKFEITKDAGKINDDYLNEMVARNELPKIEALAQQIWPDSRVDIAIDTNVIYPDHTDLTMSYEKFLQHYPTVTTLLIGVYLNGDSYIDQEGNMNQEAEVEKYKSFVEVLADNKYVSSGASIYYLTPEAYSRFDEAKKSDMSVSFFYREIEENEGKMSKITVNGFHISKDGQIKEGHEEFYRKFEIWQKERQLYIEKRGGSQ